MKLALIICVGLCIFSYFAMVVMRDGYTQAEKQIIWNDPTGRMLIQGISIVHYGSMFIGIILGLIYLYQIL